MLAPIIIKQIVKLAKGTARFDAMADKMIEKFELGCPPTAELQRIIQQKQQIISALSKVSTVINTITKIGTTLSGILTGLSIAVNIIKFLPIPLPPFSPALLATGPAAAADAIGDLIKAGKGAVSIIPSALKQIADGISALIAKLNTIDGLLNPCLTDAGLSGDISNTDLNNILNSAGLDSNPGVNEEVERELTARLQPNASNPLLYKGWLLIIQNDPLNTFTFPSRRVEGQKDLEKIYNLSDKGYSFSSSATVLVDEIKFRIDLLVLTDPALLSTLDSNQSGSMGAGSCSLVDFGTQQSCEANGGIWTPINDGTSSNGGLPGSDTTTFGSFNFNSQGPNRLMGPGVLTPKFGDAQAKIMIETPPATLTITATTGNLNIDLGLITLKSKTELYFELTPDAGGTPITKIVSAGPGQTNVDSLTIQTQGRYSYKFLVSESKFPKNQKQKIGLLELS
tara:strand:+ start:2208 stop:3569 length:1362 start_codon:yes stop_codon:yes gene_type:complete